MQLRSIFKDSFTAFAMTLAMATAGFAQEEDSL